jgi:NAD(P)-dependent dehydrogenase (short-subunit alcohol dehydrogenase family)
MDRRLKGKVAPVTGASSGIGWSTAVRLGQEGALVGVNCRSEIGTGPRMPAER